MTRLIKIEIEAITKEYVHYKLTYAVKTWINREEEIKTINVVHNRFHSLLHKTISGLSLVGLLERSQHEIVHAKLMLIIGQGKNEYIFQHETTKQTET